MTAVCGGAVVAQVGEAGPCPALGEGDLSAGKREYALGAGTSSKLLKLDVSEFQ